MVAIAVSSMLGRRRKCTDDGLEGEFETCAQAVQRYWALGGICTDDGLEG
jgi:hypothetical protein